MRNKWSIVSRDSHLRNAFYNHVLAMHKTGSVQKEDFQKLPHEIYQSRRIRQKDANTGICISYKYVIVEVFLSKIQTFGDVDLHGGVCRKRINTFEAVVQ